MTTNTASPVPTASTATDPRAVFARATALACDVVAAVRPDQLADPTPCPEYDARALIGHLVFVLRRVAAMGRGEPLSSVPPVSSAAPDDGWAGIAREAAGSAGEAWRDPASLQREVTAPFGTLPGAAVLATYVSEVTTHTWDLAVATGQHPAWDDDVLEMALAAIRAKLPTAERGPGVPFGTALPVRDGAPLLDRLVAWQGRNPAWTRPS